MSTPDDVAFFFEHGAYSWGLNGETQEQGRARCAQEHAEAEANARRLGYSFRWDVDDTTSEEFSDERPFYRLWCCVAYDADRNIVASLGGVDFGRDCEPWGDPYRRVVEAELALEAGCAGEVTA